MMMVGPASPLDGTVGYSVSQSASRARAQISKNIQTTQDPVQYYMGHAMYWTTYAGEGFAIYGQGVAVDGHVMALGPLLASGPRAMALAPNSAVKRFQYLEGATDVNPTLIPNLRERGWTVEIVEPGHPEYARMVQELTAGEYLGRSHMRLLQKRGENIKQVTVLEEFLHATQDKIPRFDIKHPYPRYEIHVKDFMIRHRRMLGLEDGDVLVLE